MKSSFFRSPVFTFLGLGWYIKEHYNVNYENPQFINYVDGYNLEFVEKAEKEVIGIKIIRIIP